MIEHVLKHSGEAVFGHELKRVRKVAIVAIRSHRNTRRHLGIELGRIKAPLFASVTAKKLFVELPADATENDIFGGPDRVARFGNGGEKFLRLLFIETKPVEPVESVEIDWDRQ